jgi:hypothetical protein
MSPLESCKQTTEFGRLERMCLLYHIQSLQRKLALFEASGSFQKCNELTSLINYRVEKKESKVSCSDKQKASKQVINPKEGQILIITYTNNRNHDLIPEVHSFSSLIQGKSYSLILLVTFIIHLNVHCNLILNIRWLK